MDKLETIIASRPDKRNKGSCPPWKLRHLFSIAKSINPHTIIESGTWKGNSLWLFRNAFPYATIYSFDIDYSNLMHKHSDVYYTQVDIEESFNEKQDSNKTLIFFDDHVNQKQRLEWSRKMGFKHIIFDDNIPTKDLTNFKLPPIPTLEMLRENGELPDYIEKYKIMDYDGSDPNAINSGQSYLTYVILKND